MPPRPTQAKIPSEGRYLLPPRSCHPGAGCIGDGSSWGLCLLQWERSLSLGLHQEKGFRIRSSLGYGIILSGRGGQPEYRS